MNDNQETINNIAESKKDSSSTIKNIIIIVFVIVLIGLGAYIVFNEDHKASVIESYEKNNETTTTKKVEEKYVSTNTFKETKLKDGNDSFSIKLNGKVINLAYKLIKEEQIASESGYEFDYDTELTINGETKNKGVKLTNVRYSVITGEDNKEYLVFMINEKNGYSTSPNGDKLLFINDDGIILDEKELPLLNDELACHMILKDSDDFSFYLVKQDGIYYASSVNDTLDEEGRGKFNVSRVSIMDSNVKVTENIDIMEGSVAECE